MPLDESTLRQKQRLVVSAQHADSAVWVREHRSERSKDNKYALDEEAGTHTHNVT